MKKFTLSLYLIVSILISLFVFTGPIRAEAPPASAIVCDRQHGTATPGHPGQPCADCIIWNARNTVNGDGVTDLLDYYRRRYGMVNTDCGLNIYYPILYCKPGGDDPANCARLKGDGGVCHDVCAPGSAGACSLSFDHPEFQTAIPGMGTACGDCIAAQKPGDISFIKGISCTNCGFAGNETCTNLQIVKHMCNGGVSEENKQGCLAVKNGACASACSGTGSTSLSATIAGPTSGNTSTNLTYVAKADGTNLKKVFIYIAKTTDTLTSAASWTLLNPNNQDCGGSSHCEKTVSFMPSANNVSYYVVVNAQDNAIYCSGSPATNTPPVPPCKSGSDRITLTTTPSTTPTGKTWKYRIAENPTDLANTTWLPYPPNEYTFLHNFNVTGPVTKTIFVEFMDTTGKTGGCGENSASPCQASIDILGPNLSTCTAFTPDGLADGGTDPGTGAAIYKTSSYNDVGVRTLSATYSPTTATLTPAASPTLSFGHRQTDNKPYVVIPTNDDITADKDYTVSATVAASGGTAANCPSFIIRVPKKPANTTCTYASTQTKFKTPGSSLWLSSGVTVPLGGSVTVAGFHNGSTDPVPSDISLSYAGPNGESGSSIQNTAFTPSQVGNYTFTATTTGKSGGNCTGNSTFAVTATSSPSPSPAARVLGDATNDGCVNYYDKNCWANEYAGGSGTSADFDNSGHVDLTDYAIWLSANNSGRYVCSAGQARIACVNR